MPDPQVNLQPGGYYHIYNHAVGRDDLFERSEDYHYFLSKMKEHVLPVSDVLSYCLMPNHFHLVVRIKDHAEVESALKLKTGSDKFERKRKGNPDYLSEQLSKAFSNFFNTYAKHYNFVKGRGGTLFKRNFRRKRIEEMMYLKRLICYVHQNPVVADFVPFMEQWRYSSYSAILSSRPTMIPREEIIDLFGDLENLKYCHKRIEDIDLE